MKGTEVKNPLRKYSSNAFLGHCKFARSVLSSVNQVLVITCLRGMLQHTD